MILLTKNVWEIPIGGMQIWRQTQDLEGFINSLKREWKPYGYELKYIYDNGVSLTAFLFRKDS